MSKVSIIIPAFNCDNFLSETLDSVLAQTYRNWECIIVDDGSTDNTCQTAQQFCSKDSRFIYLYQDNQGTSTARNNGIRHSSGTYILPLDSDDTIEPSYLELAINHLNEHPETKLVYCLADTFGATKSNWNLPAYHWDDFIWENCLFCSAVYRRSDYNNTPGYNPNMKYGLEDWDFWLSLLRPEDKVFRINQVLFHYRVGNMSRTTTLFAEQIQAMYRQIYINHPDIYKSYGDDIIFMTMRFNDCQRELASVKEKLNHIKSSPHSLILHIFRHRRKS